MTGEMSKAEAQNRDLYPLHHAIADAVNGTVEPFDVYQGPYVAPAIGGRLWIVFWSDGRVCLHYEGYPGDPCGKRTRPTFGGRSALVRILSARARPLVRRYWKRDRVKVYFVKKGVGK